MSFKYSLHALVAMVVFLCSCSKENEEYYSVPNVKLKGAACFSGLSSKFEKYFRGEASEKDVDSSWDCVSKTLVSFTDYVDGQKSGVYKAVDLRVFLEKYFLNSTKDLEKGVRRKISDALLDEAMEIKRLFLGGQRSTLTKVEALETLVLINELRRISKDLLPYTYILFNADGKIPTAHQHRDAERALEKAFRELMDLIGRTGAEYDLKRLEVLFKELDAYIRFDEPESVFGDMLPYLPSVFQAKGILLNSPRDRIGQNEWPILGSNAGRIFSLILRGKAYFSGKSLLDPDQLEGLYSVFVDGLSVLKNAIKLRDDRPIPNSEVNTLITELAKADLLPLEISVQSAQKLWLRLVDFILNPQNIYPASGLSSDKLNYLDKELNEWFVIQNALIYEQDLSKDPVLLQMKNVLNTPWPVRLDTVGRVIIDGNKSAKPNLESVNRLNWSRALFKLLFNAYITDINRLSDKIMSATELKSAFTDLKDILVAMDLIESDDNEFHKRLFRDANLFMPRSDGDEFFNFYEAIEYLHFIYAGIDAGKLLVDGLLKTCHVGDEQVNVECFRSTMKSEYRVLLEHMPRYLSYAKNLNDKKWKADVKAMEDISRAEGSSNDPVYESDIYETFIALQYIETLFLRFDTDQTGDLNLFEVLKALKHFKNVLKDIFKLKSDEEFDEMTPIFTYVFKYGSLPDPNDPLTESRLNNWTWNQANWKLSADRGTILQILALISKR
jgi:hypothetical protein